MRGLRRPRLAGRGQTFADAPDLSGTVQEMRRQGPDQATGLKHGGQCLCSARLYGLRSREAVRIGRAGEARLRDQKLQMSELRIGAAACAKTAKSAAAQASVAGVGGPAGSIAGLAGYAARIR